MTDLRRALLAPQSLAIIGASDDVSKTTGRPLAYLRRSGWAGRIYPINPRRDTVQGEKSWPSVAGLPEVPEHALILTPKSGVREAVSDCARAGVGAASVLAGGFAEAGDAAAQDDLVQIARAGGLRLLGPSSLGYADPRHGLILTANAAFAEPGLRAGRLFAASHSGSMIGALASRGAAKGVGFAGLVSVGVEADLSLGEICEAALDDPEIDGFLLFLESLRHASALRRFALKAFAQGKPVIAYKLGRSAQAAELAQSHTGALAGEDAVADAFFRACGIARLDTLDGLLEAPALARRSPPVARSRPPRVGVVATTGGGAAMVVDQLGVRGVEVWPPSAETWARLAAAKVEAEPGRVVDLTLAGTRYEVMKAALDILTTAPEFDLVVVVAGSSARFHPELAVQPAIDSAASPTPLAVFATPEAPDALRRLAEAGVPAFRTPESCADAIAAVLKLRPPVAWIGRDSAPRDGRFVDEAEAYARLAVLGVPVSPYAAVAIGAAPPDVGYPVAVKALSADLPHKTDAGGVRLGVQDAEACRAAVQTIVADVAQRRPDVTLDRVLVQAMAQGVGEVLVGFRRDPEAGPLILIAPGGVLAEIRGERALRLAPVDLEEARAMIAECPSLQALAGYRGLPAGDLAALAGVIAAVSGLAEADDVVEAEINPLIVRREGEGVVAVDALMRVSDGAAG